jgi:uncharacterized protein YjdB
VSQVVTSVVVTPGSATLAALGATQGFAAEGRDANGHLVAGVTFTWASGDPSVATIDAAAGVATAEANGGTTITADAGTASGSAALTVAQEVVTVTVFPGAVTLTALGATQQLIATGYDANGFFVAGAAFTWSSADPSIVTVDPASGVVTAVANGSATVTGVAGSGAGSATVTVSQEVASVVVTPDSATLTGIEQVQQFAAEARDANGNPMTGITFVWASDDTAVATVDATGRAVSRAVGVARISATVGGVSGVGVLSVH